MLLGRSTIMAGPLTDELALAKRKREGLPSR